MVGTQHTHWYDRASRALHDAGYRRAARARWCSSCWTPSRARSRRSRSKTRSATASAGARAVSRASVYRILDELEELGLVARLDVGQATVRFEAMREGSGHHHHLVCDHCGTLTPFTDAELERTIRHVSERVPLAVSEHEIVLHGACDNCVS